MNITFPYNNKSLTYDEVRDLPICGSISLLSLHSSYVTCASSNVVSQESISFFKERIIILQKLIIEKIIDK